MNRVSSVMSGLNVAVLVAASSWSSFALADLTLARDSHCMACHSIDRKVVGPAFRDVAKRYAGQPDMRNKLAHKIISGGSGAWGPVPMPANSRISEEDAKKLADWILALK